MLTGEANTCSLINQPIQPQYMSTKCFLEKKDLVSFLQYYCMGADIDRSQVKVIQVPEKAQYVFTRILKSFFSPEVYFHFGHCK